MTKIRKPDFLRAPLLLRRAMAFAIALLRNVTHWGPLRGGPCGGRHLRCHFESFPLFFFLCSFSFSLFFFLFSLLLFFSLPFSLSLFFFLFLFSFFFFSLLFSFSLFLFLSLSSFSLPFFLFPSHHKPYTLNHPCWGSWGWFRV